MPPPVFKEKLQSTELQEEETATFHCEVSQPNVAVQWKKGAQVISSSSKYEIRQEGTIHTLKIYHLKPEDSGKYTCDNGNEQTTASLTVKGRLFCFKRRSFFHFLGWVLMRRQCCHWLQICFSDVKQLSPFEVKSGSSKLSNCFHKSRPKTFFVVTQKTKAGAKISTTPFWFSGTSVLWAVFPPGQMVLKNQSAHMYLGTQFQVKSRAPKYV